MAEARRGLAARSLASPTIARSNVGVDAPSPRDCLAASRFLDADDPAVVAFARGAADGSDGPRETAVALFAAVRDGLTYDPYTVSTRAEDYRAGAIARRERAFCVQKAVLLAACARALGIPARLRFGDVRNHLASPELIRRMGTDVFAWHGSTQLWIDGRWVEATPAFDRRTCARLGVQPLQFDGRHDATLQEGAPGGGRLLAYVRDRGVFADLPFEPMVATFRALYGLEDHPPGGG